MKVQSINNYTVTQNNKNNRPIHNRQQSFGLLIVDERGMEEHMAEPLKRIIRRVFTRIKSVFEGSEELKALANQTERDVLVHPFQDESGRGGIMMTYSCNNPCSSSGKTLSAGSYWDHELERDLNLVEILGNIRTHRTVSVKSAALPEDYRELPMINTLINLLSGNNNIDVTTFAKAAHEDPNALFDVTRQLSDTIMQRRFSLNSIKQIPEPPVEVQQS